MTNVLLPRLLYGLLVSSVIGLIVLPVHATLKGSVCNNDKMAQQNTSASNLQAQIDAVVPPAPSRFTLSAGQQHLISDLSMQQFRQPRLEPRQAVTVHLSPRHQQLRSSAQHQLSAIGLCTRRVTGLIYYVDPHSDLMGRVNLGDYLIAINGVNTDYSTDHRWNIGSDNTLISVTIRTTSGIQSLSCHRHPVNEFGEYWHSEGKYWHSGIYY